MATINNTLLDVGGTPQSGVVVTISLVWDKDLSPVARLDDSDSFIVKEIQTVTNGVGEWSVEVSSNSSILPTGSLYQVTEGSLLPYFINVPDSATPIYWVGDILAAEPDYETI